MKQCTVASCNNNNIFSRITLIKSSKMPSIQRKFGDIGENVAKKFLVECGFLICETNYRKLWGEIDIIARKNRVIHFVEVKSSYYYPDSSFTPEIRVNKKKIRNLKRICETYLHEYGLSEDQQWQIDVVSVTLNKDNALHEINYIENAIFEKSY